MRLLALAMTVGLLACADPATEVDREPLDKRYVPASSWMHLIPMGKSTIPVWHRRPQQWQVFYRIRWSDGSVTEEWRTVSERKWLEVRK